MPQTTTLVTQTITDLLIATQRAIAPATLVTHTFIQRRWRGAPLIIHAQCVLYQGDQTRPFFLLWDHDDRDIWHWQAYLQYLHRWVVRLAKREVNAPLLIVSHTPFRAQAMLALAELTRPSNSPLIVAATAEMQTARQEGLLAVSRLPDGWRAITDNDHTVTIDPFLLPPATPEQLTRSRFTSLSTRKSKSPPADTSDTPTLLDTLPPAERATLAFLCHNPVIPEPALATLLDLAPEVVAAHLAHLAELGLAERAASGVRNLSVPMWAANELGLREWLTSEMLPLNLRKRYSFYRADHERRAHHTLAVYSFFADLKQQCARRGRTLRKLDAPPSGVNEGKVPHFELESFESECTASDWFASLSNSYYFRPDGLGALRAGHTTTYFWVEIDGTTAAPSRHDPKVWMGKLARLCDYIASGRWALRYPELPRLLIVTTDLRNISDITDARGFAARSRYIEPPRVFVASAEAVRQREPLAKIWREVGVDTSAELGYAWEGVNSA